MIKITKNNIFPVILSVPLLQKGLATKERVKFLSSYARLALKISAYKKNIKLNKIQKGKNGEPLPVNGYYWSLSHKPDYVAGVISSEKIGIDIEQIKNCSQSLFKKIANDSEWDLISSNLNNKYKIFFRYWTAKEAVLKANSTGLKDLPKCHIVKVIDEDSMILKYNSQEWRVEHFFFDTYIASVTNYIYNTIWSVD